MKTVYLPRKNNFLQMLCRLNNSLRNPCKCPASHWRHHKPDIKTAQLLSHCQSVRLSDPGHSWGCSKWGDCDNRQILGANHQLQGGRPDRNPPLVFAPVIKIMTGDWRHRLTGTPLLPTISWRMARQMEAWWPGVLGSHQSKQAFLSKGN